jgi:hypothetical protein
MQSLFPIVVFGAVGLSVVMSIVFLLSGDSVYDDIGRSGLDGEGTVAGGEDASAPPPAGRWGPGQDTPTHSPGALQVEREREIRQMLQARSERLVRRGEPALDIDAEVAALTAQRPARAREDEGIAEEVLQLVVARNERRERQGLAPLDVEAEVARTLAELNA